MNSASFLLDKVKTSMNSLIQTVSLQLIYKYNHDSQTRRVVDGFDWYILPSANPDGYEYSWTVVTQFLDFFSPIF